MAFEATQKRLAGVHAAADLSTKQFCAGKLHASDVLGVDVAGAGQLSCGIIQNDPLTGQAIDVAYAGQSKALLGATVSGPNLSLSANASGALVPAVSGDHVVALSMEGGASGNLITVLVMPQLVLLA